MKKKCSIFTGLCFVFLLCFITLIKCFQTPENPEVVRSSIETFTNGYIQTLSIVLHKDHLVGFESCAKELIERCRKNDFENLQFSYDLIGYPSEVHGFVYLTESDYEKGSLLFTFSYKQTPFCDFTYDIYNHSEKYSLDVN